MAVSGELSDKIRNEIFSADGWATRRRWMKMWTIGIAVNGEVVLAWIMYAGGSAYLTEIFMACLTAIIAVMFAYVFGAVWDDHSKRRFMSSMGGPGAADDAQPDTSNNTDER